MSNIKERDYRFGDYQLAAAERVLRRNGEIIPLPLKSLEVLLVLLEQYGRVVSKEELMEQVWHDCHVEEANLARHIYTLRRTLGERSKEAGGEQRYILTVPGRGYRFVMDVQAESLSAGERDEEPIVSSDETPVQMRGPFLLSNYRTVIAFSILFTMMLLVAIIIGGRPRVGGQPPEMTVVELTSTVNVLGVVVSPNGKYIVMKGGEKGQRSIWVRFSDTGAEMRIVPPSSLSFGGLTISPDSNFVYYNAAKEHEENDHTSTLYQVPILGGEVRKIKEGLSGPVTFAPDGIRYAFVREDSERRRSSLLLSSLNDDGEKELIARETPAEYLDYPAWSPDGSHIVCTLNTETGESRLLEVSLADGREHMLTTPPSWRYIHRPIWMKDGSGLLVPVNEGFNLYRAWFLPFPLDSKNAPWLMANGRPVQPWSLNITDDGRDMVITQNTRIANVWVASIAVPEGAQQITTSGGHYEGLAWTPDGQLLYASDANNFWNIWVMKADGTGQRSLTSDNYEKFRPSISHDGRYVFFTSNRNRANNIWRINADGSNPTQLTFSGHDVAPQCTPDGQWVVFASLDSDGAFALCKVPVEGGLPVRLRRGNMEDVVVSPDGKFIACLMAIGQYSRSIKPSKLTVISLADGAIIRYFDDIGFRVSSDSGNSRLRWMPDGSGIVYTDQVAGSDNLWVQPLVGGPPRRLTNFSGDSIFGFDISSDGKLAVLRGLVKYQILRIANPNIKPGMR